ncbi:cytochrome c oxidase assembly protein [Caldovatus aquaticus]|uniref:Cytochrome c oxidase assembly protein CtaG n=1 Tax=Caldovatus aquaticus TaxID=2865671 RepID=A0ABS7F1U8_9PROT|nr:cytochrome c oxidase assembly protein [Caldovatus aquaticus]MBW8269596.1 cytochrome c oxidase assembly protein [Caldovatus aquaticus]
MPPHPPRPPAADLARRNRRLAAGAFAVVFGMVGLSFAAVPLYRLFCQVTGYGGTPAISAGAGPDRVGEAVVTVRFAAATHPDLPWRFAPAQGPMRLRVGEEALAFYTARNLADRPVTGVAVYNVTPEKAGRYFHKTACFCFEEQTLAPGQEVEMPLSFWVDPRLAEDPATREVRTITIHYSFFRSLSDAERAGTLASAGPHVGRRAAPAGAAATVPGGTGAN